MDAKEYFQSKRYVRLKDNVESLATMEEDVAIELTESYHQAKSKEEAGERYERAKASFRKVAKSNSMSTVLQALIEGHLLFAAGLKEGKEEE